MRVREAKEQFQHFYSGSGRSNHENEWVDESEKSIACRIAFFQWAVQNGFEIVAGKHSLRIDDFREGGREHLIYPQDRDAYKSTNWGFFGYAVELEGGPKLYPCQDPVRYLDRFVSVEEIWGLTTDFIGVYGDDCFVERLDDGSFRVLEEIEAGHG